MSENVDVIVVGAGPNGLMLACELSLAGVQPLVLERLPQRAAENRANGLVGQVVRMLDRRGLYQRLSANPRPPQPAPYYAFGALPLALNTLDHNPVDVLPVPQRRLEQLLEERATELGVRIRRGHELAGMSQDIDGVTIDATGPDGAYQVRTRYLVGADGGRSLTRKLSGIEFPGASHDGIVSRTAHATVPATMIDPVTGGLGIPGYGIIPPFLHHRTERGLFVYAPFPTGPALVSTMEFEPSGIDDQPPLTLPELRDSVRRVLGVDVALGPPEGDGPHLLRRLAGGNTRLAERYRDRRILLVGDAAHVHSAIGGPGLNLGLQDAVNLGWKLAAVVHGWTPATLLDSYETERRPVGQRVVMSSQAQSALIAPGPSVTALRELFTELLGHRDNVQHIADLMSGADIRYDMGSSHQHLLVGRFAPDMLLDGANGPTHLAELTANARPLLLDMTVDNSLADELSGRHDRVDIFTTTTVPPDSPATALLLRPDCHIAWASSSSDPDPQERIALRDALTRWFGTAGAATRTHPETRIT